ncbi:MAG TPA: hypothetical protein VN641_20475 [Urbifossiella sp.]|nr:hypothetical protein [Urbifossiella sp.]
MNLSRAAKKFRAQMPQEPEAPRRAKNKHEKKAPPAPPAIAVPEPSVSVAPAPEPTPEPVAQEEVAGGVPKPKKAWPVKAKRPRFVREKVEKRERPAVLPDPPPRSTNFAARLLTKNLAVPPKDDEKPLP